MFAPDSFTRTCICYFVLCSDACRLFFWMLWILQMDTSNIAVLVVGGSCVRRTGVADVGREGGGLKVGCDAKGERRPPAPHCIHARRQANDCRSRYCVQDSVNRIHTVCTVNSNQLLIVRSMCERENQERAIFFIGIATQYSRTTVNTL